MLNSMIESIISEILEKKLIYLIKLDTDKTLTSQNIPCWKKFMKYECDSFCKLIRNHNESYVTKCYSTPEGRRSFLRFSKGFCFDQIFSGNCRCGGEKSHNSQEFFIATLKSESLNYAWKQFIISQTSESSSNKTTRLSVDQDLSRHYRHKYDRVDAPQEQLYHKSDKYNLYKKYVGKPDQQTVYFKPLS